MTSLGRVLTSAQMRARAGFSQTTEWRLNRDGEGPPRIKLSKHRFGYPEHLFEEWLAARFVQPKTAA